MIVVGVLGGLCAKWQNIIRACDKWLEQSPEDLREDNLHESIALLNMDAKKHKVPLNVVIAGETYSELTPSSQIECKQYKVEIRDASKHGVQDSAPIIEIDMGYAEKFEEALHSLHVLFYRRAAELGYTSPYLSNLDKREPS